MGRKYCELYTAPTMMAEMNALLATGMYDKSGNYIGGQSNRTCNINITINTNIKKTKPAIEFI